MLISISRIRRHCQNLQSSIPEQVYKTVNSQTHTLTVTKTLQTKSHSFKSMQIEQLPENKTLQKTNKKPLIPIMLQIIYNQSTIL